MQEAETRHRAPVVGTFNWVVLIATWITIAGLLVAHVGAVRDYLSFTGRLGLRGRGAPSTPLTHTSFSVAADGQTWIRLALEMGDRSTVRLRHTDIDDAPLGRDVHWSSEWALTILNAGRLQRAFTGQPLPAAVESVSLWLNSLAFLLLAIFFSVVITRRFGAEGGVLAAFGMLGSYAFSEGFTPSYLNTHGLLTAATFGTVLGAVLMGAGWWRATNGHRELISRSPESARSGAILSAVCGAVGLWMNGASAIPAIAAVGISGLFATVVFGRRMRLSGASFDARSWQIWGRVGGALSLCFYLLDYAPQWFSWRLEVNHPLHALAWLCAGEIIAIVGARRTRVEDSAKIPVGRVVASAIGLLAAPLAAVFGGTRTYGLHDRFLTAVQKSITDFRSLGWLVRLYDSSTSIRILGPTAMILALALIFAAVRPMRDRFSLWFTLVVTLLLAGLAYWQVRWLGCASAAALVLGVVLLSRATAGWRREYRLVAAIVISAVLFAPEAVGRVRHLHQAVATGNVDPRDRMQAFFRDIAMLIRESQPSGDIVLLASPASSTAVGYYGRFKTVGTLYWENIDGLKDAARIFTTLNEQEAIALIRERHITHIAMITAENMVPEFFTILHPELPKEKVKDSFGGFLFLAQPKDLPPWLQPIPYTFPPDLRDLQVSVRMYRVVLPPA